MLAEQHHPTHLILDLDPPADDAFAHVVATARLVQQALADSGLAGAVKTSGAKGLHVFVPLADDQDVEDVAAATRALAARAERLDPDIATTAFIREDRGDRVFVDSTRAGGATVVAAYSPRARPGLPVSFPVTWDQLDDIAPRDFTVHTAPGLLADRDPWQARHAGATGAARRPGRRGSHHPDRPGAGHARGQTPGPGAAAVDEVASVGGRSAGVVHRPAGRRRLPGRRGRRQRVRVELRRSRSTRSRSRAAPRRSGCWRRRCRAAP